MKFIQLIAILSFLLAPISKSKAQTPVTKLSGKEKAFIYHVIWENERLEAHLGKYFEYIGEPYFKNDGKTPKRDSIEISISANPANLLIRKTDLAKVSKGMLMELCNKIALHDLNLIFKNRISEEPHAEEYKEAYQLLIKDLVKQLPPAAVKEADGKLAPLIKIEKILSPTYSSASKINVASSGGAFDASETKMIVDALNQTIEFWVANKAKSYFEYFGGRVNYLNNQLMAAGDGGGFPASEKERNQDEWYRGLTHPIGFFYYQNQSVKDPKSRNMTVKAKHIPVVDYKTYGHDTLTNIHFDIWGRSQERQPTVVIQKGMYSYILYGKEESNLLSPDSAYGKEGITTYQMLIDELKNVHIAYYENLIYGKEGYDYQIEFHQKQGEICQAKIKTTEYKLNQIRYKQGSGNITNYKPKDPKKNQPSANMSVSKEKKTTQDWLMYWYEKWEFHKGMVIKLKKEKEIAIEILATLNDQLSDMNKNLGYKILKSEKEGDQYIFEDSSTFNYETQDFKFNKNQFQEEYTIRILSFGEKVLNTQADEVMIHWSVTEEDEDEKLAFNIKLEDAFGIDSYKLGVSILSINDSVKIKEFINYIHSNPKKIQLNLSGNGLGAEQSNGKLIKQNQPSYFDEYPSGQQEKDKALRSSTIKIDLGKSLNLSIASYTDGFKSKINPSNKKLVSFMAKNAHLTKNEILTALRTMALLYQLANEIEILGSKFFENGEQKTAANLIRKMGSKAKIQFGNQVAKGSLFLD